MGALLKTASKYLLGGAAMNPQLVPQAFTKLARKIYVASLLTITAAWYTGWKKARGDAKGEFPIPGLAKAKPLSLSRLSDLPGLTPFKKVLDLPPVTGVTDATGSTPSLSPPGDLGKLPGALGTQEVNLLQLGRLAQQMGLRVSENPLFGGVTPGVHVQGSLHYKGRAIDVSAPLTPQGKALMATYANAVAKNYGSRLTELFWRGPNWVIIKNGVRQSNRNFVDGHEDHVHVGI